MPLTDELLSDSNGEEDADAEGDPFALVVDAFEFEIDIAVGESSSAGDADALAECDALGGCAAAVGLAAGAGAPLVVIPCI